MTANTAVQTLTNYARFENATAKGYQAASMWALGALMGSRSRGLNTGERMTLLATAMAADIALGSANGYSGHTAGQIATVTGVSPSTSRSHHRALVRLGLLVESTHPTLGLIVRIPEDAFQA